MISAIINWSLNNRWYVILTSFILLLWGCYTINKIAIDAIPDLSDVQVIIKVNYPGKTPQIIEDQVTYPLTTTLLSIPEAKTVRGYSFLGDAYIYVLFSEKTDLYWARSRVIEYLNQAASKLPNDIKIELGPDATGVGWIYQYALVDRSKQHNLANLRSIQDWFLKFELQKLPGVAEVATIGGMVKEYQIILDPNRLRAYQIPLVKVADAIKNANQETAGSVIEMGEAEYMIKTNGYLKSLEDIEQIPIKTNNKGVPVLLKHIAHIQIGPKMRRGIAELNGQGEVVGGVIIMRNGGNAINTIAAVKKKLTELQAGLPKGVEIIPTYDRSFVIKNAVTTLKQKLLEESIVVIIICLVFLNHLRSGLIIIIILPISILISFIAMYYQNINANIMSLGGIAIAIGAMVDAIIVMLENTHKHYEIQQKKIPISLSVHLDIIRQSSIEVGPALFVSLLIITFSFIPLLLLQAQEGKLFSPLIFTKTYAMAAAAILSITLAPVLMYYFVKGNIPHELNNPINKWLKNIYSASLHFVLDHAKVIIGFSVIILLLSIFPIKHLGTEFMPSLNEGDLLYMPSTLPNIAIGPASQLLQQTDRLIASVPEVATVFGKMGRADTATDPAPLEMMETTIQLKPMAAWRPGMTIDKITNELNNIVQIPSLANVWTGPIRNRIDMQATGIKSPLGIKIAGADLSVIEQLQKQIEALLKNIPGTRSVIAERLQQGRYIIININRLQAARYELNIQDIQQVIALAVGGEIISETIEGLERYPIILRYPQEWRNSIDKLKELPIITANGLSIPLSSVANISFTEGPVMLKSENARLNGWIYIDIQDRDLGSYVNQAQEMVSKNIRLPTGYSINWSGQYESMIRATHQLLFVIPITLLIIFGLIYWIFKNVIEALLIMLSLPFALIGGFWLVYLLDYHLSIAVAVGFIALAGVAIEFGVIMLLYLNHAYDQAIQSNNLANEEQLKQAIMRGAALRLRPKTMTVAVIAISLIPIMLGHSIGSDVMQRIAAPMIGGIISAPILSLFIVPAIYFLWKKKQFNRLH